MCDLVVAGRDYKESHVVWKVGPADNAGGILTLRFLKVIAITCITWPEPSLSRKM